MNSGSLAVIYDLSYLELEMAVDELDIGKVAVGQEVEITADALEGQTFSGVVDKVSINGTTARRRHQLPRHHHHRGLRRSEARHERLRHDHRRHGAQCPVHPRGCGEPGQHGAGARPRRPE